MASKESSKDYTILLCIVKGNHCFPDKVSGTKVCSSHKAHTVAEPPPPCPSKGMDTLLWRISQLQTTHGWYHHTCKLFFHFMFSFIVCLFESSQILVDFVEICKMMWWSWLAGVAPSTISHEHCYCVCTSCFAQIFKQVMLTACLFVMWIQTILDTEGCESAVRWE